MTTTAQPWQSGDCDPAVSLPVDTAEVIALGDLLAQNQSTVSGQTNLPIAAAHFPWDTNLATTQEEFHDAFLGVSLNRSRAGDTDPIVYATRGKFYFNCASSTWVKGQYVGAAKDTGNALLSDTVVSVATAPLAIGKVARHETVAVTQVLVEILGTVDLPETGPQAVA